MKSVGLLLVGLLCVSVMVHAGEFLMNDTGESVFGLHVVFSEPVRITAFGDVLTSVAPPSGESSEFTFSGGVLEAWGGHWFNWEPATVTLETHWWLDDEELVPPLEEHEPVVEESIEVVMKSGSEEQLLLTCLRRISDRSIPFFVEYVVDAPAGVVELAWDFNHLEDSDWDGQFRNDHDASGLDVLHVYYTNRTQFVVSLRARDEAGLEYTGEDEISFVVQAGDTILLGATGTYARKGIAEINSWSCESGDPNDPNWIVHSDANHRWLAPEYPGVAEVQAHTEQTAITTNLYVFNATPDFLEIKGVGFCGAGKSWSELEAVAAHLEYIRDLGFTWVSIGDTAAYDSAEGNYTLHYGTKYPFDPPGLQADVPYREKIAQLIGAAHDADLKVNLVLALHDTGNQQRWMIEPTDGFFFGEDGYFSYVKYGIELANETKAELLVANTELGAFDRGEARPYLEEEVRLLEDALDPTFSFSNFFDPGGYSSGRPYPRPWASDYGAPLEHFEIIGFSTYAGIASNPESSIAEMQLDFEGHQLRNYSLVLEAHEATDLHVFASELGYPAFDGGAMDNYWEQMNSPARIEDLEEQRRATAASLRAVYDFVLDGNDRLDGMFWWTWAFEADDDLAYAASANYRLNDRPTTPALDEIYCFWNSAPQALKPPPIFVRQFGTRIYLDPLAEAASLPSELLSRHSIVEDFEASRSAMSYLHGSEILKTSYEGICSAAVEIDGVAPFSGTQSLAITYRNYSGEGGEVLVFPQLHVASNAFISNDYLSAAIRVSDRNIGLAWVIYDKVDRSIAFVHRLPTQLLNDWNQVAVELADFAKILSPEGAVTASELGRSRLNPYEIALMLYSVDGKPVEGTAWIDAIGLGH